MGAGLVDAPAARSLGLAAGAMAQAATQLDDGDVAAAARSVGSALQDLRNLGDPPVAVDLPGCRFP